jgi:hypothetical protein
MPVYWQNLAQCEEQQNWHYSGGVYSGAFAFANTTWAAYRLPGYPSNAGYATPWQQWQVAKRVARAIGGINYGWGCWRGSQHAWVRAGMPEYGVLG